MRALKSHVSKLLCLGLIASFILLSSAWVSPPHKLKPVAQKTFDPVLYDGYAEILSYGPPEVDYFYTSFLGNWGPTNPEIDVIYNIVYDRGFRGITTFQLTVTEHCQGADTNSSVYSGEEDGVIAGRYPGQYGHISSSSVVSVVLH